MFENKSSYNLTNSEYKCIYKDSLLTYSDKVYELYRRNKYGMEICDKEWLDIQKLFVYLHIIWSYDGDDKLSNTLIGINKDKEILLKASSLIKEFK